MADTPKKPIRKRRRLRRIKETVTVGAMVPNGITVLATCAGITAIRDAVNGDFQTALIFIVVAAVLDTLDGRMARLFNSTSKFGAELDSLSDAVSFGVAPALILYYWGLADLQGFGWATSLFFAVCTVLRLARFNTNLTSWPPYAHNYFQGLPSPAAAGVALLPVVGEFAFGIKLAPYYVVGWTTMIALLMVSDIPTYSFKALRLSRRLMFVLLVVVLFMAVNALTRPWQTLFMLLGLYILLTPLSWYTFGRLQTAADRLQYGDAIHTDDESQNDPTQKPKNGDTAE